MLFILNASTFIIGTIRGEQTHYCPLHCNAHNSTFGRANAIRIIEARSIEEWDFYLPPYASTMRFMRNWSQVLSEINTRYTGQREPLRSGFSIRIGRNLATVSPPPSHFFFLQLPSCHVWINVAAAATILIRMSLNEGASRRSLFTYGCCARGRHTPAIKISINLLPSSVSPPDISMLDMPRRPAIFIPCNRPRWTRRYIPAKFPRFDPRVIVRRVLQVPSASQPPALSATNLSVGYEGPKTVVTCNVAPAPRCDRLTTQNPNVRSRSIETRTSRINHPGFRGHSISSSYIRKFATTRVNRAIFSSAISVHAKLTFINILYDPFATW